VHFQRAHAACDGWVMAQFGWIVVFRGAKGDNLSHDRFFPRIPRLSRSMVSLQTILFDFLI
jgi:hypothetical protein